MLVRTCIILIALSLGACSFTQKIRSGADAFAVKQYAIAAQMLRDEYDLSERLEDRATRAFMIGQSYEYMRQPEMAAPWYHKAYEHRFGSAALERYAETLRQSEHYPGAIEAYQELMATGTDAQRYRGLITLCNQAIQWKKDQVRSPYQIQVAEFNSPGADYAPYVLSPELLLFTSDRNNSTGNTTYNWTGRDFSDLYTVNTSTGLVQTFDHVVNTAANEGTITFTSDRTEMYFTRCYADREFDSYCKLMMCRLRGASWSEAEVLPFVQEGINYGHPVITGHDSLLIFSCNDPKGAGGFDLYYSQRTANGWDIPVMLSERINTLGNERFPSMNKDTLYFSSDHHPGLGGYDIFKTYVDAQGQWSPPFNMKPPINSGWDDFGFVVDTFTAHTSGVLEQGYFSSSRNAKSGDDIFSYKKVIPPPLPDSDIVKPKEPAPVKYQVYLAIRTMEPVFATQGDPNSTRTGKKELPATAILIGDGPMMHREKTDENGMLVLELEWDKSYEIQARRAGYLNQSRAMNTSDIVKDPANPVFTYNMEIVLEPIFENTEVVLQDIYYDYDEWFIRDDAEPALESLAKMLRENPQLRIQLSSHTDCRGEDAYNQDLSQKRAQSAVDFLIAQGVAIQRLVPVGYGESRLAIDCPCTTCSEDQHQKNRRTTFKILPRE
ncbi:MAG TPA: OmpA family protein [Saprospiraceae bacterium]|nr:OmpA family protein [Saprospiraceae bacterium]